MRYCIFVVVRMSVFVVLPRVLDDCKIEFSSESSE